jgi:glycerophosphoryl diester phosphodiesterase
VWPTVIAHRGASGHRPEHTLAAYELAIESGADFIEPDLVCMKDGVLVVRHESELSVTTDVASHPEFESRRTTKSIDGELFTGWFTDDFTLAELKTLRARERFPELRTASAGFDGRYEILTFDEVIELARRRSTTADRQIGLYPETKHAAYFDSVGLPLEKRLVASLEAYGLPSESMPVFVQSFEADSLRKLRTITTAPLVRLVNARSGPFDVAAVATYASVIGADKNLVIPRDTAGNLTTPTTLVADAHRAGLIVHVWTFRAENTFLPTNLRKGEPADPAYLREFGDWRAEYAAFISTGLDGLFADQPELAVAARDGLASGLPPATRALGE